MNLQDTYKLSEKQARFVELYAMYGNAAKAYREAYGVSNHSAKNAYKLMKKPRIQKAIEAAKSQMSDDFKLSKAYLVGLLRKIAEDEEKPDMARLKAIELLGKSIGMFVDRIDQNVQSVQYYLPAREDEAPTVEAEATPADEAPALPEPEEQKKA